MAAVTSAIRSPSARSQRWLARLSFVLVGLAVMILAVFAGLKSIAMLAVGLGAGAIGLAAAFFFLSRRGAWRWLALVVVVLAPIAVIVVYAFAGLLWVAMVSAAAWLLAGMAARSALAGNRAGLAYARAPGGTICPAPVPDHEPEVRRREGRQVRPEAQCRRAWRRGVPDERA